MNTLFKTKKRRTLPVTLLCILASLALNAQTDPQTGIDKKLSGGFGFFSTGVEQSNLSELNRSLNANGYGSIRQSAGSVGGGGLFKN